MADGGVLVRRRKIRAKRREVKQKEQDGEREMSFVFCLLLRSGLDAFLQVHNKEEREAGSHKQRASRNKGERGRNAI